MHAHLLLVVQALVVVFEGGQALLRAGQVVRVAVDDVAGEDFLPEGEAAGGACEGRKGRVSERWAAGVEGKLEGERKDGTHRLKVRILMPWWSNAGGEVL